MASPSNREELAIIDQVAAASGDGRCPITAFTGFLGAGKTTVILSITQQLNAQPRSSPTAGPVLWIKNEFGDTEVDSRLASQQGIAAAEIVNGCVCCTSVGKLSDAITTALSAVRPSRIILETSGSSSPSSLAMTLQQLAQTQPIVLSAIICVIDCENHLSSVSESSPSSVSTRLQSRHTDLIVLNKHEAVSASQYDRVLDAVMEDNAEVAKVRTRRGWLDAQLVFGIAGSGQYGDADKDTAAAADTQHWHEITAVSIVSDSRQWTEAELTQWLRSLQRDECFRVKGLLRLLPFPTSDSSTASSSSSSSASAFHLLNFAFGRWTLTPLNAAVYSGPSRLTLIGDHCIGQLRYRESVRRQLGLQADDRVYVVNDGHTH